jgi:hypothetical protein
VEYYLEEFSSPSVVIKNDTVLAYIGDSLESWSLRVVIAIPTASFSAVIPFGLYVSLVRFGI